ncbi:MAG: anion permease [Acidobacteriota bacterium]|nr:anion permease [Acidobacteriota bacterium]
MSVLFFLSSGLFLGWSLGANDAANVFGTAVGARMIRFRTAALICGVFVVIGATVGGAGATGTLGALGAVDALSGAFLVALAAAVTVFWMSRLSLPVSTSQAIVGAIVGWNLFAGEPTDTAVLVKIVLTWFACPLLAAAVAVVLYLALRSLFGVLGLHLFRIDLLTRVGLVIVGAFGAYSLGANNIANVMGVFVESVDLPVLRVVGLEIGGARQLFFLGSLAIAVGVATYSRRVMETVGSGLLALNPQAALVAVLANALVLFVFSSQGLESWLVGHGLPALPLVPVSSTQAVVGAVLGIGLLRGGHGIRYRLLGGIGAGWVLTPVAAGGLAFGMLFVFQNLLAVG